MQVPIDSVGGATALSRAALLAMSVAFSGGVAAQGAALTHEPVLGDLTERSVRVWLRLDGAGSGRGGPRSRRRRPTAAAGRGRQCTDRG